jgi:hypothetical protein
MFKYSGKSGGASQFRWHVPHPLVNAGKFFLLQLLWYLRDAFWTGRKIRKSLRCKGARSELWVAGKKT